MKKLFMYMTVFAAMAMMVVSCSKDDDDTDSTDNRLKFTNLLTQNSTSGIWEGYETKKTRSWGSWSDDGKKFVVMRFDRSSKDATNGTGLLIQFENEWKEKYIDQSEFNWGYADDELRITYRHSGWAPVHAEYRTSEIVIKGDRFDGTWFESSDTKFEFNYTKSSFNDWNKYIGQ